MAKRKTAASEEINSFAYDLFEFIWTKHRFYSADVEKKIADKLTSKIMLSKDDKISHFNQDIGNSVLCSQYLLRNYLFYFFTFLTIFKTSFYEYVDLVCTQWIVQRDDVFTKIIDTCAIIAEAILFCDLNGANRELDDAPKWFIERFKKHYSKAFFKNGGWEQLSKRAVDKYANVFEFTRPYTLLLKSSYDLMIYDCGLIRSLKTSPVMFPIHEKEFCEECLFPADEQCFQRIICAQQQKLPEATNFVSSENHPLVQQADITQAVYEVFRDLKNKSSSKEQVSNPEVSSESKNMEHPFSCSCKPCLNMKKRLQAKKFKSQTETGELSGDASSENVTAVSSMSSEENSQQNKDFNKDEASGEITSDENIIASENPNVLGEYFKKLSIEDTQMPKDDLPSSLSATGNISKEPIAFKAGCGATSLNPLDEQHLHKIRHVEFRCYFIGGQKEHSLDQKAEKTSAKASSKKRKKRKSKEAEAIE